MPDVLAPGFRVGHYTDEDAATGCTVVLPPAGNVASCEIRGSSPGSREVVSLDARRRLTEVHAVLLTGGSAFGLAAADGVMQWLAERGIGYETTVARVPIVPAAVIFDLGRAGVSRPPGPNEGRSACDAAVERPVGRGRVGAGTGATVGKWAGPEHGVAGGVGLAAAESEGMRVGALAVVNAVGNVLAEDGSLLAGSSAPPDLLPAPRRPDTTAEEGREHNGPEMPVNTVLTVVATNGSLDKREVQWLAARATDGVTKSIEPAHTRYDGDVTFAIAAPGAADATPVDIDVLGALACNAVARAVRDAVRPAD